MTYIFQSIAALPTLPNFVMGIIGIGIGILLIVKAYYLNHHILFLGWIESKWGSGTGTIAYRMIGLGMCIFSIFVMTGWIDIAGNSGLSTTSEQTNPSPQIQAPQNNRSRIAP